MNERQNISFRRYRLNTISIACSIHQSEAPVYWVITAERERRFAEVQGIRASTTVNSQTLTLDLWGHSS